MHHLVVRPDDLSTHSSLGDVDEHGPYATMREGDRVAHLSIGLLESARQIDRPDHLVARSANEFDVRVVRRLPCRSTL